MDALLRCGGDDADANAEAALLDDDAASQSTRASHGEVVVEQKRE